MARAFVIGMLAALAFVAGARAADPPRGWPAPPEVEPAGPVFTELMSGWYLRGDVGYRYNEVGSVRAASPVIGTEFADRPGMGAGVGYKHDWLRADVTIDYGVPARVRGTTATPTPQPQYSAKIETALALANVYLDLGTWWGVTPYVGAGAGAVHTRSRGYNDTTLPPNTASAMVKKLQFAWAAMAGVSYQVSPTWVVDVGYRYIDLGLINTDVVTPSGGTTWENLTAQEIRIGVRFLLD